MLNLNFFPNNIFSLSTVLQPIKSVWRKIESLHAYDQESLQARIFLGLISFSHPANPEESRSELMNKALNYLKNFWNQIFAYRNNGEYSIDNMAAERAMRPITVQRKSSITKTCKQVGVSFRDYFCRLHRELKK